MKINKVKQILEDPKMDNKNCNFKLTSKTSAPAWFVEFKEENDKHWANQEKFNEMVLSQFKKHGWIK